jgi:hypothetical protein
MYETLTAGWPAALPAALLATLLLAAAVPAEAQERRVTVNRTPLTAEQVAAIERQYRVRILDGHYWYDARVGVWGFWGGPAVGWAIPGLGLGGPLLREASGGGTGVFVNGRELHPTDVAALRAFMSVLPGRYWLDASGWGGLEGWPPAFNLWALAAQAGAAGRRGGSWIDRGAAGGMGGDGDCVYYIGGDASASVGC